MSEVKRAINYGKAMVGHFKQEWDRISAVDAIDAERELNEALEGPVATKSPTPTPSAPAAKEPEVALSSLEQARKILGVTEATGFSETKKIYERILKRADPTRFPEGSLESAQAATLRRRVEWAYHVISESVDATERRFGSLEID